MVVKKLGRFGKAFLRVVKKSPLDRITEEVTENLEELQDSVSDNTRQMILEVAQAIDDALPPQAVDFFDGKRVFLDVYPPFSSQPVSFGLQLRTEEREDE